MLRTLCRSACDTHSDPKWVHVLYYLHINMQQLHRNLIQSNLDIRSNFEPDCLENWYDFLYLVMSLPNYKALSDRNVSVSGTTFLRRRSLQLSRSEGTSTRARCRRVQEDRKSGI